MRRALAMRKMKMKDEDAEVVTSHEILTYST
jgi:hypothetical protein